MTEHPILFKPDMVRAVLAGTKTQTRRLITPQPVRSLPHTAPLYSPSGEPATIHHPAGWRWKDSFASDELGGVKALGSILDKCPYGKPGDHLWVRETWSASDLSTCTSSKDVTFAAGCSEAEFALLRWRPSIFMPRWASRITLEVTDVRVERLHDLSEEDALAEGIAADAPHGHPIRGCIWREGPCGAFAQLWEDINGKRSPWSDNAYVWAISFKRVAQPTRAA